MFPAKKWFFKTDSDQGFMQAICTRTVLSFLSFLSLRSRSDQERRQTVGGGLEERCKPPPTGGRGAAIPENLQFCTSETLEMAFSAAFPE